MLGGPSGVTRTRPGSSRCDFVGLDPAPSPAPDSRRASQAVNTQLQAMIDEWIDRPRPSFDVDCARPHLLLSSSSSELSRVLELGGGGDRLTLMAVFPWMVACVRAGVDISLGQLKQELFDSLKRMSIPQMSMVAADYVFRSCVGGELEDLFDEEMLLGRLGLTQPFPMLFLYEPEGLRHEKEIAHLIGLAIGTPLADLESRLSDELKTARVELYGQAERALATRGLMGYEHFAFPEEKTIEVDETCPHSFIAKIETGNLRYQVYYRTAEDELNGVDNNAELIEVDFDKTDTPHSLIAKVLQNVHENEPENAGNLDASNFLLQTIGQRCYLTGNERLLVTYANVRSAFENFRQPQFVVRRREIVLRDYPKPRNIHKPSYVRAHESRQAGDEMSKGGEDDVISLWDIDDLFKLRPISCTNLGSSDSETLIYVAFSVQVGKTVLARATSGMTSVFNPRWNEKYIEFELYMKDIPSSAILSICLVEASKTKAYRKYMEKEKRRDESRDENAKKAMKTRRETRRGRERERDEEEEEERDKGGTPERPNEYNRKPLGWLRLPLVEWKNVFLPSLFNVGLWPGGGPGGDLSNHFCATEGYIGENEAKTGVSRLIIDLAQKKRMQPPTDAMYESFIESQLKWGKIVRPKEISRPADTDPNVILLNDIQKKYQIGEKLTSEEEIHAWNMRYLMCVFFPDMLILLVDNDLTWRSRENFVELYNLLKQWKPLSFGAAFQLLDKTIIEQKIRDFAVAQIEKQLDDTTLTLFILPLIQVLKCELRSSCALGFLLLRRALTNYQVGQKLFWLLRSELSNLRASEVEVANRIALILEAYLRGSEEHLRMVVRQVDMVDRLTKLSVIVKGYNEKNAATKRLRDELREQCTHLENIDSPLDPTCSLGQLQIDKCRVLGSAKMPLRLSWKNVNPLSQHGMPFYEILFKNGDDLRQDMLVLQMLEVMDSIWRKKQLDGCLSIYPVLPMGTKIGMIGVVPNCVTIFEIQSEGGKVGTAVNILDTTVLNRFIRKLYPVSKEYLACVDRFLMSCVAYSVATYVMGIKDRHNDNIMMTNDGRLFHIDFGHILGHGKTKLGIQRDRAPFVVTEHFLAVIGRGGADTKNSHEVLKFKQMCLDAYIFLWEHRALFLSLFSTMRNMELPELSSEADLEYLKSALCISTTDDIESAKTSFQKIMDNALQTMWSTKTNWFFHTVKHI